MRKLVITSLAGLLALSAPALAQARSHHAKHHQGRHHHSHVLFLRPASKSSTGALAGPQGPGSPSEETAGSVTTFEGGVLTVTLNDGTKVTGKVTEHTEIKCEPAQETAHAADHGGEGGEDSQGSSSGDENQGRDDQGDDDQNDQEEHGEPPQCGTSSLVAGALVREAKLRVSSSGAVFEEIELVG